MYLAIEGGRKLALVKAENKRLPKRAYADLAIRLNGAVYPARVTSNIAWCGGNPAKALEYIWVEIEGVAMYVTLNYGEKAASFKDAEFTLGQGVGDPLPKRVTATKKASEREAGRIVKFKVTWAARNDLPVPAEAPAETPSEETADA